MGTKITSPDQLVEGATYILHSAKTDESIVVTSGVLLNHQFNDRPYVVAIVPFSGFLLRTKLYLADAGVIPQQDGTQSNNWLESTDKALLTPEEIDLLGADNLI